jgi:hypothetical protein
MLVKVKGICADALAPVHSFCKIEVAFEQLKILSFET